MTISTIDIGAEFSSAPYGGHRVDSDYSGERFREEFLEPIFTEPEKYSLPVNIVLDTVAAFSAAFLQEAFGGLVREGHATPEKIRAYLKFVFEEHEEFELYVRLIAIFIAEAAAKKKQEREGAKNAG